MQSTIRKVGLTGFSTLKGFSIIKLILYTTNVHKYSKIKKQEMKKS